MGDPEAHRPCSRRWRRHEAAEQIVHLGGMAKNTAGTGPILVVNCYSPTRQRMDSRKIPCCNAMGVNPTCHPAGDGDAAKGHGVDTPLAAGCMAASCAILR